MSTRKASTRKVASMDAACLVVNNERCVTDDGVRCDLRIYYALGSSIGAVGRLNKWSLHQLAREALDGLAAIERYERDRADFTAGMITQLKGGGK